MLDSKYKWKSVWYRLNSRKTVPGIDCEPVSAEHTSVALKQHSDLGIWYQRLGHLNAQHFKDAIQKKSVNDVKIQKTAKLSFCEGCVEGKMH